MITVDASAALKALDGLKVDLAGEVRNGIVTRLTKGVFAWSFDLLSGDKGAAPGSYPVPVRTGHLRRALYMILPDGRKTSAEGERKGVYAVEPGVGYVGNSAIYAKAVHEGRGRVPARRYLTDAARQFMGWAPGIAKGEVEKAVKKHGLN